MRFSEASPESSGCESRGKVYYRRTAKIHAKGQCPNGKLRCCVFCNSDCSSRCQMSSLLEKQPQAVKETFECVNLRPSMELAWKWLGNE